MFHGKNTKRSKDKYPQSYPQSYPLFLWITLPVDKNINTYIIFILNIVIYGKLVQKLSTFC